MEFKLEGINQYQVQMFKENFQDFIPLPDIQQCVLVKLSSQFFQYKNSSFNQFSYLTQQQRQKLGITKKLKCYFAKRYFFFSKFDYGIQMDQQSWYSVIAEPISFHIVNKLKNIQFIHHLILDPFAGVGGLAIPLTTLNSKIIAADIDINKLKKLQNNSIIYKVNNKIKKIHSDFFELKPFPVDLVVLCPPWGGVNIQKYQYEVPDKIMKPKLSDILKHALKFSNMFILQMPKNSNIFYLLTLLKKNLKISKFHIQRIYVNENINQLIIYIGNDIDQLGLQVEYQQFEKKRITVGNYKSMYRYVVNNI